MIRKFISNLGLLLALNLIIKPLWVFGIDRNVQNIVGSEEYGLYFVFFDLSYMFSILLDLGITNYNNRHVAQHKQTLGKYFSGLFKMKLGLSLIYLVFTLGFALFIGYRLQNLELLFVLALNQFLASALLFMRSNISGLMEFRKDSFLSVLDKSLMILFCGILIWGLGLKQEFQIEWFAYAQTLSYMISVGIAFLLLKPYLNKVDFGINRAFVLSILKQSAPFAILILGMSIYYKMGSVLLDFLSPGSSHVGEYAKGYRILDSAIMLGNMFVALLFPMFSRLLKEGSDPRNMLRTSSDLLMVPSVVISAMCLIFGEEIMLALYPKVSPAGMTAFTLLMLAFVPISLVNVYGSLLTAAGKMKYMIYVSAGAIMINLTLNFLITPEMHELGTAVATLSAHSLAAVLIFGKTVLDYQVSLRWRFSVTLVAIFPLAFITSKLLTHYTNMSWTSTALVTCAALGAYSLGLKLIQLKEIGLLLLGRASSLESHVEEEEQEGE